MCMCVCVVGGGSEGMYGQMEEEDSLKNMSQLTTVLLGLIGWPEFYLKSTT